MTLSNNLQPQSPSQTRLRWFAGGMFLLSLSLLAGLVWLLLAGCSSHYNDIPFSPALILGPLAWALLGLLIVFYRPDNLIGWLCLLASVTGPTFEFTGMYAACGIQGVLSLPGVAYAAWINFSLPILGGGVMAILLPQLYPNGRFLSVRWRRLVVGLLIIHFAASFAVGLLPDFSQDNGFGVNTFPIKNPFGLAQLPAWWQPVFSQTLFLSTMVLVIIGIISMIVRFRRSVGDERQQIKWLAYFLGTAVTLQIVIFELLGTLFFPQVFGTIWYQLIVIVTFLGFPLTICIAIFKYRLYAIDVIIRRTLAYAVLSAILATAFFGSVAVLQSLFATATGQQSAVVIVISTLLIAALFNPLRLRIQGWIDRRFFRRKYNAAQTLAAFAATARDEVDLDALTQELVRVLQETMQPAHVSVWFKESNATAQRRQGAKY